MIMKYKILYLFQFLVKVSFVGESVYLASRIRNPGQGRVYMGIPNVEVVEAKKDKEDITNNPLDYISKMN